MRKLLRHIAVIKLSILYCFVLSWYSSDVFAKNITLKKQSNPQQSEHQTSFTPSGILCHAAKTESSISVISTTAPGSTNSGYSGFSACIKALEQVSFATFSQYTQFARNLLVRFRQADIIFPFHYFW